MQKELKKSYKKKNIIFKKGEKQAFAQEIKGDNIIHFSEEGEEDEVKLQKLSKT